MDLLSRRHVGPGESKTFQPDHPFVEAARNTPNCKATMFVAQHYRYTLGIDLKSMTVKHRMTSLMGREVLTIILNFQRERSITRIPPSRDELRRV